MQLDPSQEAAVNLICSAPFCIVTGGPGTGKSTCLREALNRMDERGETYRLASPTGKAAKRMTEATGRAAGTIHRLLGWTPFGFEHNGSNPIDADVIIIDEASMLDTSLAADLADACAPSTRLVFVGDANQLPSVGPGRVLADLVDSGNVPVARLTTVHRAAAESWVCRNAPRVLSGDPLELEDCRDFRFVECEAAGDVASAIGRLLAMDELRGAQVLTPQRTTACGVEAVNALLQATLNPARDSKPEWKLGETIYRLGDRVIQTSNNYTLEVFNGEVGEVCDFDGDGLMVVNFGDRKVSYSKGNAFSLDLAYALTIHKSQGSEFPWVVCVVHSAHTYMLTRNLFYTGITRAKKGVVIVGNRAGLRAAIEAKDPPKRNTRLVDRMRELLGESGPACAHEDAAAKESLGTVGSACPAALPANDQISPEEDQIPW